MAGNSSKGSAWEREFCKFLTEWLTGQRKEIYYWRSAGSGGLSTRSKCNAATAGDMIAVRPEGEFFTNVFCPELKKGYPSASMDLHLKDNKSDPFRNFWKQAVDAAAIGSKHPMLVVYRTRTPPWVGIPLDVAEKMGLLKLTHSSITLKWSSEIGLPTMFAMDMEQFFKEITPDKFKEIFR